MEHFDVLIIGAGLSGIGAGARLRMDCPDKTFAILEGREASGGTWDLFRYPGIRSDSDMFTLGYRFRPWRDPKAIADGPAILKYIRDTAREYDLDKKIRYGHRVRRAEWDSKSAKWTVLVETAVPQSRQAAETETRPVGSVPSENEKTLANGPTAYAAGTNVSGKDQGKPQGVTTTFTCNFLYLCTGYYDYEAGYTPDWPGFDSYKGTIVHPQKWPETLDFTNKNVLVIGSGATAITLVPAMAETAGHVTMLQRSPTYIVSLPSRDRIANILRVILPEKAAYAISRWKNLLWASFFYKLSRSRPALMKKIVAKGVAKEIGEDLADTYFKPKYEPWDQRMCFVPDSDLFRTIRDGKATIVNGEIEQFTETGLTLTDGRRISADIIVTATGLVAKIFAGMTLVVDGEKLDLTKTLVYRGMMFSDIPNLALAIGYTNNSWTLKCDLTSEYVCRLINYLDKHGYSSCMPRLNDPTVKPEPVLDFNSGYVLRALKELPSQGSKPPWRLYQNYIKDLRMLRRGRLDDGTMEFRGASQQSK